MKNVGKDRKGDQERDRRSICQTQHHLTTCVAVSPESIVIPIVSCILGFPLLALFVICCLRKRAKLARERERRRAGNCDDHGTMSMVRFSPIHRLGKIPSERSGGRLGG
uniref:(California timema) hypothetical protein n=1 Tax=Timema californicum TaxID=61474 RepID=A0A7R9JK11_TIMCA|nr:unnamed protein product [Timema californicum]